MRATSVIKVAIGRPYDEVYDFLTTPRNLARWGTAPGGDIKPMDDGSWLAEVPSGEVIMRFTPRNPHGVLDYSQQPVGSGEVQRIPVRLYRNEDGAELVLLWRRKPGDTDERFDSDVTWATSDLERLKALLEAG